MGEPVVGPTPGEALLVAAAGVVGGYLHAAATDTGADLAGGEAVDLVEDRVDAVRVFGI